VDTDRAFFKVNSLFCFYIGVNLLSKAVGQYRSSVVRDLAHQDLDKYLDLVLRHFAQQSFYFAVFAGYIPALMLISLMVSLYLYLHERSKSISLIAFVFGTALGAVWLSQRLFGTAMTVMASKYMTATSVAARQDLFTQVKSLYYFDSLSHLLSGQTSLIAYALFGLLFLRGKGL
jgi:dipeptide/tripeptide permease